MKGPPLVCPKSDPRAYASNGTPVGRPMFSGQPANRGTSKDGRGIDAFPRGTGGNRTPRPCAKSFLLRGN